MGWDPISLTGTKYNTVQNFKKTRIVGSYPKLVVGELGPEILDIVLQPTTPQRIESIAKVLGHVAASNEFHFRLEHDSQEFIDQLPAVDFRALE